MKNEKMSKPKLLFWIDSSIIHFGIAKSIQDKLDAELFSIFELTDQPKSFFETQSILKFKEQWFYHDHIKKIKSEPDLNYLSEMEKKYEINLWRIAINERIFNDFKQFYRFSQDEILLILEQTCKFCEQILDKINPDFIIMPVPHQLHMYIFYQICKSRKIKLLILHPTHLGADKSLIISENWDKLDPIDQKKLEKFNSSNIIKQTTTSEDLKKSLSNIKLREKYSNYFLKSKKHYLKAAIKFLFSENSNQRTHYTYWGRTKIKVILSTILFRFRTKYRQYYINKNFKKTIPTKKPFILFTTNQDMERILLLFAPYYTNQIEVIRHIAKSIPVDYCLVVKEHPLNDLRGWKNISKYNEISEIPNVHLLHPNFPINEIMEKCSLLITIRGSTAIEAAFYGKPCITFEKTGQIEIPSRFQIHDIHELPSIIRKALSTQVNINDVKKYLKSIEKLAIDFDKNGELSKAIDDNFYSGGFLRSQEIKEEKMLYILNNFSQEFDNAASAFIKKINELR